MNTHKIFRKIHWLVIWKNDVNDMKISAQKTELTMADCWRKSNPYICRSLVKDQKFFVFVRAKNSLCLKAPMKCSEQSMGLRIFIFIFLVAMKYSKTLFIWQAWRKKFKQNEFEQDKIGRLLYDLQIGARNSFNFFWVSIKRTKLSEQACQTLVQRAT